MKLTPDEARSIVWEDNSDWETIEENVVDNSRWSIHKEGVFKHLPSGKFYELDWSIGATESQDESPFEYQTGDITPIEVELVEVLVKKWVSVKK